MEKTAWRLKNLIGSGPSKISQINRYNSALRRMPGMKGLCHRAEILAQSGCLASGDAQRSPDLLRVKADELSARHGRAQRATSAGRMKAVFIMTRRNRLCDFALHFDAEMIGKHEVASGCSLPFRKCQNHGQNGCSGMNKQAIDAIGRNGQLCVIEIIGMN